MLGAVKFMAAIMYVVATGKPVLVIKYEGGWSGRGTWIDATGRRWLEHELTVR